MRDEPTIFARASGGGRAAIAVVRLSGPRTADTLRMLAGPLPPPRHAVLRRLRDPTTTETLDQALVLWFPGPASFTGEDAAEFHLHGGRAVVEGVLRALATLPSLRPAEAGEFTRRAFRNGKMDLTEVEGLADLIEAETAAQRRQALRQFEGALGRWATALRESLIEALALAEAMIDFSEEDDLAADFAQDLQQRVADVSARIRVQALHAARGEALRDGLSVAILGAPNVGKSTLLNRLAGRDVAMVSAFAGTTRDAIEVDLDLEGYALRLIDTAGLRETLDPLEQEGIRRARLKAAQADLVLWLDDGAGQLRPPPSDAPVWRVATKCDLGPGRDGDFAVSAETGAGLDDLIDALTRFAQRSFAGAEDALVTRLRHRQALESALGHLAGVGSGGTGRDVELVAEDLRGAIDALGSMLGTVGSEEVLGRIFARFCIGK